MRATRRFGGPLASRLSTEYHSIRMDGLFKRDKKMPASDKSNSVEQWVRVLRTLADPVRVRILHLMECAGRPALRVGELADALKMPQSTISRHLKTLLEADLIEARR